MYWWTVLTDLTEEYTKVVGEPVWDHVAKCRCPPPRETGWGLPSDPSCASIYSEAVRAWNQRVETLNRLILRSLEGQRLQDAIRVVNMMTSEYADYLLPEDYLTAIVTETTKIHVKQ